MSNQPRQSNVKCPRSIYRLSIFLVISLLFGLVLGANYWQLSFFRLISSENQRMLVIGMSLYLILLTFVRWKVSRQLTAESGGKIQALFTVNTASAATVIGLSILVVVNYFQSDSTSGALLEIAGFFCGSILGQVMAGLELWCRTRRSEISIRAMVLNSFTVLLSLVSLLQFGTGDRFHYREEVRWCGIWDNPNVYGLLMGAGITMALGQFVRNTYFKFKTNLKNQHTRSFNLNHLWLAACAVMCVGWIKSYSRGAWLAALCGIVYLICSWGFARRVVPITPASVMVDGCQEQTSRGGRRRLLRNIVIILLSLTVILFYNFRFTEQRLAKRAVSLGDKNDMSWRNRIETSVGALQMIGDKPWLGCGWNQLEAVYNNYYRPTGLTEGKAIILNSYLMFGTMIGFPSLFCLLAYFYLRFRSTHNVFHRARPKISIDDWEAVTCRAGFIVFAVGLALNGGLFYIPLGVPLWILLELGSAGSETDDPLTYRGRRDWWIITATVLAFGSLIFFAQSSDPFKRIEFKLRTAGNTDVKGVVVLPKSVPSYPVVAYLHPAGQSLIDDGVTLRQFAELGIAAVSIEYNQTNTIECDRQLTALFSYLRQQRWAVSNATALIGFNLGARRLLDFQLKHPESQPQLIACLGTEGQSGTGSEYYGIDDEIKKTGKTVSSAEEAGFVSTPIQCPVLFIHGERDEVFSIEKLRGLVDLLRSRHVKVATKILPDKSHGFTSDQFLIIRLVGEYCKSIFLPLEPFNRAQKKDTHLFLGCLMVVCAMVAVWMYAGQSKKALAGKNSNRARHLAQGSLHWITVGIACFALGQMIICLVVPQLRVSKSSLSMARKWLVPAGWRDEFASLSGDSAWHDARIKTLLDYAQLSNYNRQLINWKLEDSIYREFVISPQINSESKKELGWRRPLWETFYPRIRKLKTSAEAAQIVVRYLRERIAISNDQVHDMGVESIWKQQVTDEKGFQMIYVAALRSVGVAARQSSFGQTEFWTGEKWVVAPQPISYPCLSLTFE